MSRWWISDHFAVTLKGLQHLPWRFWCVFCASCSFHSKHSVMANVSLSVTNFKYDFNSYNGKRPKRYWVNKTTVWSSFVTYTLEMSTSTPQFRSFPISFALLVFVWIFFFLKLRDDCVALTKQRKLVLNLTRGLPERKFFSLHSIEIFKIICSPSTKI